MMKKSNSATLGFEEQIWKAADVLRGNMDASEYKHIILGLIFLKYISDAFETKFQELVDAGEGFENDADFYLAENIFFVPEKARWKVVAEAAHTPEIGMVIDRAMREIEASNQAQLKDILPKNFARPELDKRRLGEIVDIFTNIKMTDSSGEKDVLGRTYEYCLSRFAANEGKNAGEFYTPASIVRTLVEILQPFEGIIYDPCCGSGGMFVQSQQFIQSHQGNIDKISVYGQDSNPTTRKLALMNLAIRGIEANLGKKAADTFFDDQHPQLKANFILANPPFNLSDWGAKKLSGDARFKYGVPPEGNANYAWIQHMIYHLAPGGKIGLVLANGSLSSQTSGEGEIRRKIIEDDLIEAIVAMPTNLFYNVTIPVCLWIIGRDKKQKGKTLFLDCRELGEMVNRKHRELREEDIKKITTAVSEFEAGKLEDVAGFCKVATTAEIAEQDYILTPGRYVGVAAKEDDGEPFEEKMTRLTGELGELFKESEKLERQIRENLKELGYEIK